MSAKHTPGPWSVMKTKGCLPKVHHVWEVTSETEGVCLVILPDDPGYTRYVDERSATARLIAAAPDLLDCLIHLQERDWFKDGLTGEVVCVLDADKVRAAIDKAKGESK